MEVHLGENKRSEATLWERLVFVQGLTECIMGQLGGGEWKCKKRSNLSSQYIHLTQ